MSFYVQQNISATNFYAEHKMTDPWNTIEKCDTREEAEFQLNRHSKHRNNDNKRTPWRIIEGPDDMLTSILIARV